MTLGRMEDVKNRLMTLVSEAHATLQPQKNHISGDWSEDIWNIKMPFVKVRLAPVVSLDLVYGRRTPELGQYEEMNFSLHIFTSANQSADNSESRYKDVHIIADAIKDNLNTNRYTQRAYEIYDIYDLVTRESEPAQRRKAFKLCRVIVEGKILVRRTDS